MSRFNYLTGRHFGRLIVTGFSHISSHRSYWNCVCICGKRKVVVSDHLTGNLTTSCGCFHKEKNHQTFFIHGQSETRLYTTWSGMKKRCLNENEPCYKSYGGRGIRICDKWIHNFAAFRSWALSNGYADNLTIDRKDNDGDYEPGNCQWLTRSFS